MQRHFNPIDYTRAILIADGREALGDYIEYLTADGYIVRRIRESSDGRFWLVTFQTA